MNLMHILMLQLKLDFSIELGPRFPPGGKKRRNLGGFGGVLGQLDDLALSVSKSKSRSHARVEISESVARFATVQVRWFSPIVGDVVNCHISKLCLMLHYELMYLLVT